MADPATPSEPPVAVSERVVADVLRLQVEAVGETVEVGGAVIDQTVDLDLELVDLLGQGRSFGRFGRARELPAQPVPLVCQRVDLQVVGGVDPCRGGVLLRLERSKPVCLPGVQGLDLGLLVLADPLDVTALLRVVFAGDLEQGPRVETQHLRVRVVAPVRKRGLVGLASSCLDRDVALRLEKADVVLQPFVGDGLLDAGDGALGRRGSDRYEQSGDEDCEECDEASFHGVETNTCRRHQLRKSEKE